MAAKVYSGVQGIECPDIGMIHKPEFKGDLRAGLKAYDEAEAAYIKELRDRAKRNGRSSILGEVIRFGVADGYAQYVVWRSSPLELIHVATGDAWHADRILLRGLTVTDVKDMVARDRRIAELFSKKAVTA